MIQQIFSETDRQIQNLFFLIIIEKMKDFQRLPDTFGRKRFKKCQKKIKKGVDTGTKSRYNN